MNKVFQINLSGIIISIDEPAYEKLNNYINKLKIHFSDSPEIVSDIQSRMAELFLQKVGSNNIVYINHVDEVIAIMGNTDDILEENEINNFNKQQLQKTKKLRRNPFDENLGGVCSGIAAFLGVDPVLIRILFVASVIIYGTGILFYLILWAVLPKADGVEAELMKMQKEHQNKKLFRDSDNRILGGVCSGLANYFVLDVIWVRILFVASLFLFGTGFWLYILLWIIIPKAVSANDKLLMKGILPSVKNLKQYAEQYNNQLSSKGINKTSKVVRNAFKLFATILAIFVFLTIISFSIAAIAFYFGVSNIDWLNQIINMTFTEYSVIWSLKLGLLITLLIPLVSLLLLLLKISFHIKINSKIWALTLSVAFITGLGLLLYSAISFGSSISYKNTKNKIIEVEPKDTILIYGIESKELNNEIKLDDNDAEITIYNKGMLIENNTVFIEINNFKISQLAYGKEPLLKIKYQSKGKNAEDANAKIKQIVYEPIIKGNKIYIPQFFCLYANAQFRWQEISVEMQVPENTVIIIDETAKKVLDDSNIDEADGSIYKMKNGILMCNDCSETTNEKTTNNEEIKIEAGPIKIKVKEKDNEEINISINDNQPVLKKTEKVVEKDGKKIVVEKVSGGGISIERKKTEPANKNSEK